jgi:hypothetical protein
LLKIVIPVAAHDFLREPVDEQGKQEEHEADHKERAVVDAVAHHLAHLLRDDAGHGVHRLEDDPQAGR